MHELALFAGAGGGILGGHILGWRTICAVERDPYAASVLLARQNDGCLPTFPIWDDVRTFDGNPWRGLVDVVSGGFPCQDISAAGRGAGIDGERSGLWSEMARIIGEVRPRYVFVENSPILTSRGLGRVLGDLAALGFDAEWGVLGASDVGAPHKRERIWIVADASCGRLSRPESGQVQLQGGAEAIGASDIPDAKVNRLERRDTKGRLLAKFIHVCRAWPADPADAPESDVGRVAHGVAARVDRLKAIGNGQVPRVAATAFRKLITNY